MSKRERERARDREREKEKERVKERDRERDREKRRRIVSHEKEDEIVRHDYSCARLGTRLIRMCDMTHPHVCRDSRDRETYRKKRRQTVLHRKGDQIVSSTLQPWREPYPCVCVHTRHRNFQTQKKQNGLNLPCTTHITTQVMRIMNAI